MAIQRPAEGAVVRKADFDRNDQHSLSSGRGLRRAAAPTVEGGCALDSRPGTPDCSKAAPVGRPTCWPSDCPAPARPMQRGPDGKDLQSSLADTALQAPRSTTPALPPQCDHTCLRRILAGTRKATRTPLPTSETRERFRCTSRLRPPSATPDITRTGQPISRYRPSHLLEIEALSAAVLPTTKKSAGS